MDDDGAIAKEGADAGLERDVRVGEAGGVAGSVCAGLPVLAAQVADLTSFWSRSIARWIFAAYIGIQVRQRAGAITV